MDFRGAINCIANYFTIAKSYLRKNWKLSSIVATLLLIIFYIAFLNTEKNWYSNKSNISFNALRKFSLINDDSIVFELKHSNTNIYIKKHFLKTEERESGMFDLESEQEEALQDAIDSVSNSCNQHFDQSNTKKITIKNQNMLGMLYQITNQQTTSTFAVFSKISDPHNSLIICITKPENNSDINFETFFESINIK